MNVIKSAGEVTKEYDIRIKRYHDGTTEVRKYDKKIKYIEKGYERISNDKDIYRVGKKTLKDSKYKEIRKDSLARSRDLLIDYACENEKHWKSFITLTFKENITDIDFANRLFRYWVINVKKVIPGFMYLCVPEFQKRGAIHYHILTNLDMESEIIKEQKGKINMYDVKYWEHGFSSVFDIKNKVDEHFNIALYMCKYMFKDIDNRLFGRNKILKSNNLKKPSIERLLSESKTYIDAINYIKEKGILYNRFVFEPKADYQIPFTQETYLMHKYDTTKK